ncbi:MAG: beta-galactosidase [Clostridia bacterium]|nr:beta-galactosidase [Clostridia bacterium]
MNNIPRFEHPTPQFLRKRWRNLNGEWEFEFDFDKTALQQETFSKEKLEKTILIPFCPESDLSRVGYRDYIPAICYQKSFVISEDDLNHRIILHFGAVDYKAHVYVNKKKVGIHIGGYTPFHFDITDFVVEGENKIFLYAEDDVTTGLQCSGKQTEKPYSYECRYTRTTGIWQTVWLEFVPEKHIKSYRFYPDVKECSVLITGETHGNGMVNVYIGLEGDTVGIAQAFSNGYFSVKVPLTKKQLWEIGKGGLYDVKFQFEEDCVSSYFGLREIQIDGYKILINGKSVFQRLVLDQGYYPDGIYTAPSDDALKNDILLSMNAGFNGARLHEKVFEPRYLYHADCLGYLVWGEYPDWGINDYNNGKVLSDMLNGWVEAIHRDFNHPSIIGWCPFNETWKYIESETGLRVLETFYTVTKQLDPTRPCIDASGNFHSVTDIYDLHDYDQDPVSFGKRYQMFAEKGIYDTSEYAPDAKPFFYKYYQYQIGTPSFVSEYGGIRWDLCPDVENDLKESWGYGNAPKTEKEFMERYRGLTETLLKNKYMFGFCYTQLYDVEQEKNGLYTYERSPKFDMEPIKNINIQTAEIEKE